MPYPRSKYEIEILKKYLKAPTIEQIFSFVKEVGVSYYQFERFYSMPRGTLKVIVGSHQPLPVKYWPIFYDRIIPTYGTSYQNKSKQSVRRKHQIKNKVIPKDTHDRLQIISAKDTVNG